MRDGRVRFRQAKNKHRNPVDIDIPAQPDLLATIAAIWKIQHDWSIGFGCTKAITGPLLPIVS